MSNIILALDTSMNYCSVAIYKKGKIYTLSKKCNREHTTQILPMIHKIILLSNITMKEIDYISFSKGPGNFTGIRIAMVIAQSFSLSLNIPILGVSTLAIIAEQAYRKYQKKKILVAIYTKNNKIYWAEYIKHNKLLWIGEETESLININEIKNKINHLKNNWLIVGNGWEIVNNIDFLKFKKIKIISPNAQDIIPFSLFNIKNKNFLHTSKLTPNYLNDIF